MSSELVWARSGFPIGVKAYSGQLLVGSAVEREAEDCSREWAWWMNVGTERICVGDGVTVTRAQAKQAIEQAWQLWLAHAALTPVAVQQASP